MGKIFNLEIHFKLLLLIVSPVVESERCKSKQEDDSAACTGHLAGVGHQEVGGEGVEDLDPGEAAPAQVVARPVQRDVQRVEVARLPVEELQQVQVDQSRIDNWSKVEAISLYWGDGKVEDQESPAHHTKPTVGQLLDVHT